MEAKKTIVKSTLLVTIFSFIGIFVGLILQLIIANYYGASIFRDLYFIAIAIPLFLTSVINGSFGLIFLPKIVDLIQNFDSDKANEFITSSFCFILFFNIILLSFFFIFNNFLIQFFFNSYDLRDQLFISELLYILMPSVLFNVMSNLLGSLYQVKSKFLPPAISLIFSIIINIIFLFFFNSLIGIKSLAYGYLLGTALSFIMLLPSLKAYSFRFNLSNIDLLKVIKTSSPLFFGGLVFRSTNVIEKYLASSLAIGSISYLGYSGQIMLVLGTLTSNGIGVTIYPILSECWSRRNFEDFTIYFYKSIRIILLLTIPISFFLFFYGHFIISLIFERGKFSKETTLSVYNAMKYSLPAFIFQGIGTVLVKLFYISGKTKINTLISFIETFIFIILSVFFIKYYSFIGISISLSISTFVSISLSIYFVNKNIIKFNFIKIFIDILKIFSVSIISILFIKFFSISLFFLGEILALFISLIFGMILFLLCGFLMRIDEIIYLFYKLKNVVKKTI